MSGFGKTNYNSYKEFANIEKMSRTKDDEKTINFLRMVKKCVRNQDYIYLVDDKDRAARRQKRISSQFIENMILDLHPCDFVNKTNISSANNKHIDTFYVFNKKLRHSMWHITEEVDFELKVTLLPVKNMDHEVACISISAFSKSDLGEWW